VPVIGSFRLRATSRIRSAPARTARASRTISSPSGVRCTAWLERSNSRTPSARSSLPICAESVGCVTKHAAAARPKCRWSATATA
jgi:hypothetical protein